MSFEVVWKAAAEEELAALWLAAADRAAISRCVAELEKSLRRDPESVGESRERGRRIAFYPPLGAIFRVSPRDRRVAVLHVWTF